MVPYISETGLAPPIATEQPDAIVILDEAEGELLSRAKLWTVRLS